ncbi:type II secretion system protein [Pedobacter sp. PF22-3]|uniref:type II secretion system protein n=1 Tax=Pedobacter sp. PF22-3 TaxID=2994467 RepID=UPI002246333B|nr:type II secretion system protein [Pedobacter sp. PF22-3]MCX2495296.1 type II secretion system protein [Pedobacter sp. PF22-3]
MAKLKNKQLEASTLIEVLIAMVIIMVVFSMAMGLFSNVLSSGISMRKVQIGQQLETLRLQVIESRSIEQESVWIDSVDYKINVVKQATSAMQMVEIKANDHGAPVGYIRFLLKMKDESKEN